MTQLRNPLGAGAIDEYLNHIKTRIEAGDDAAALEASLVAFDSDLSGVAAKARFTQVLSVLKQTRALSNGIVSATINNAGTGYAVGDVIAITGDGVGAAITVTSATGGIIDGISVTAGSGYTSAAADSTGVGNADATFDITVSNDVAIVEAVEASIESA